MPAPRPSRLSLLTFPQRAEGGAIRVRFLCLPKGNPEEALEGAPVQPFSTANLVFAARLIGNLERPPRAADTTSLRRWSSIARRWTRRSCSRS